MMKYQSDGDLQCKRCLTQMDNIIDLGLLTDIELLELVQEIAVEMELRLMQRAGEEPEAD